MWVAAPVQFAVHFLPRAEHRFLIVDDLSWGGGSVYGVLRSVSELGKAFRPQLRLHVMALHLFIALLIH